MTPRIYHDGELSIETEAQLSQAASHHLVKVLRVKTGDAIELFNGNGKNYHAIITSASHKQCSARVDSVNNCNTESPLAITLLQGLSRNDRMDTTLQKATELGVNHIVPVICERSKFKLDKTRTEKKLQHWRQVVISACEQSGRCTVPNLHAPLSLNVAVSSVNQAHRFVLMPQAPAGLVNDAVTHKEVCVLIGPESGLTDNELELALQHQFTAIRIGTRVLRTETAGPAVIAVLQNRWGDLN